jgi:hypothetical protein
MGKKDFKNTHYKMMCETVGQRPKIKISGSSNKWDRTKKFAGLIIYSRRGKFNWWNPKLNYKGRALHVTLLDTSLWPRDAFRAAGQGMVHNYIFSRILGENFEDNTCSVGGFAVMEGVTKYSSAWLNTKSNSRYEHKWQADGSNELSNPEKELINFAVEQWKVHGPNSIIDIDDRLHKRLHPDGARAPLFEAAPSRGTCRICGGNHKTRDHMCKMCGARGEHRTADCPNPKRWRR